MIEFKRYPHVRDLLNHYGHTLNNQALLELLARGVRSAEDALLLSRFVWNMVEQMSKDTEAQVHVLGGTDNTEMLPDVAYEIGLYLTQQGYEYIWEQVSEQH